MRFSSLITLMVFASLAPLSVYTQTQSPDTTFPDPSDLKSPQEADSAIAFTLRRIIGTPAPATPFTN